VGWSEGSYTYDTRRAGLHSERLPGLRSWLTAGPSESIGLPHSGRMSDDIRTVWTLGRARRRPPGHVLPQRLGHAFSAHHDAGLAIAALQQAAARRGQTDGVIFHTDRGSEHTAQAFAAAFRRLGVTQAEGAGQHPRSMLSSHAVARVVE
jgi:transposase InsO family protein